MSPVEKRVRDLTRKIALAANQKEKRAVRVASGIGLLVAGASLAAIALLAIAEPRAHRAKIADLTTAAAFVPPPLTEIPEGPAGEAIRRGKAIFDDPGFHASDYVGNSMACRNCHLDSGRRAGSSPMWAAWVAYP